MDDPRKDPEYRRTLREAILVERKLYAAMQTIPNRNVKNAWHEAVVDMRLKGGSPIAIRNMLADDPFDYTKGSADRQIDTAAQRVVDSILEDATRASRPQTAAEAAAGRRKMADVQDTITVEAGTCGCGCGAEVGKKSTFAQGHDAKLRSILGQAHKAGVEEFTYTTVSAEGEATTKTGTPAEFLTEHAWPIPEKPKSKQAKEEESEDSAGNPADAGEPEPAPAKGKAATGGKAKQTASA